MATIDERFHVFEGGWRARLARDVRLLRFLATIMFGWIVGGGRVRKAYRRAVAAHETLYIDRLSGRGKYD
jgi:hypothetical protein